MCVFWIMKVERVSGSHTLSRVLYELESTVNKLWMGCAVHVKHENKEIIKKNTPQLLLLFCLQVRTLVLRIISVKYSSNYHQKIILNIRNVAHTSWTSKAASSGLHDAVVYLWCCLRDNLLKDNVASVNPVRLVFLDAFYNEWWMIKKE